MCFSVCWTCLLDFEKIPRMSACAKKTSLLEKEKLPEIPGPGWIFFLYKIVKENSEFGEVV